MRAQQRFCPKLGISGALPPRENMRHLKPRLTPLPQHGHIGQVGRSPARHQRCSRPCQPSHRCDKRACTWYMSGLTTVVCLSSVGLHDSHGLACLEHTLRVLSLALSCLLASERAKCMGPRRTPGPRAYPSRFASDRSEGPLPGLRDIACSPDGARIPSPQNTPPKP